MKNQIKTPVSKSPEAIRERRIKREEARKHSDLQRRIYNYIMSGSISV
jgi:hypothetical protein